MRKKIGVCDVEPDFAYSFMEAVNAKSTCPFEVQAFTSMENLKNFLKHDHADVLLLSPEYCTEEIIKTHPNHIFSINDGKEDNNIDGVPQIYKYQRVENMIRKIMEEFETTNTDVGSAGKETRVIGIYSPVHRVGKTTFALALGQELSKREKVLFVDLEEFSGFSAVFAKTYETDLTDVIYLSRQEGNLLSARLPGIIRRMRNMDYIPPARIPLELTDLEDDWREFIFKIAETGAYDVILVDFGDSIKGILETLSKCDRIYMPISEDIICESKIEQYEEMLEQLDYTEIIEKTVKIRLPEGNRLIDQSTYMGEFVWGPIAGYVRDVVMEDTEWMTKN